MKTLQSTPRIALLVALAIVALPVDSFGVQIVFDLPSSIECCDTTCREFALAHPNLKTISGRFRISSWLVEGTSSDIIDLIYTFKTDEVMRIVEYTPNTTLESSVEEDHIEITDAKENSTAGGVDGHVAYKPLSLGGSHNEATKKSKASHYKEIAPRDTVLASGTIDREHGVVFRIRPSRTASLEGAREFTFVAVVPRNWRGDTCTISCTARTSKRTMLSSSIANVGAKQIEVGMHLTHDVEAATLAEDLRMSEGTYENLLAGGKGNVFQTISTHAVSIWPGSKSLHAKKIEEARNAIEQHETRLRQLAR